MIPVCDVKVQIWYGSCMVSVCKVRLQYSFCVLSQSVLSVVLWVKRGGDPVWFLCLKCGISIVFCVKSKCVKCGSCVMSCHVC